MYCSLYESHDNALAARETQRAFEEERNAKRMRLQTSYEDLAEMPALSSFIMIREAYDAQTSCTPDSDKESSVKTMQRDGFERIKRCRLALDALDQVPILGSVGSW